MRHVIYLLLVVNLVFFGWNMLQLQKEDGMVQRALPPIPATVVPLVSLEEMQQKSESEPESGTELEAVPEPELQEPAAERVPGPGPESETLPEPEPLEADEDLAMIESLTGLQPPGSTGAMGCQTLGPIMAITQLRSLGSKLGELGLDARHRTTGDQKAIGYWVYLPAMERSQAMEIKARLDKRKDKEFYIGKDNLISFGIFKVKSRADVRLRDVQELGLEAVMEPRYRKNTVHWLDIDRQTGDLGSVLKEYPEISLQEQACF